MSKEEMPLVQSKDDTSTMRYYKPVKLNPEDIDIDSIHDIDVFELIKDLIVNSGIAKERKE